MTAALVVFAHVQIRPIEQFTRDGQSELLQHAAQFLVKLGAIARLMGKDEVPDTVLSSTGQCISLDQVSGASSPEDGVGSVIEVVEQVLDSSAGVQRIVAVVFEVPVAPVQGP